MVARWTQSGADLGPDPRLTCAPALAAWCSSAAFGPPPPPAAVVRVRRGVVALVALGGCGVAHAGRPGPGDAIEGARAQPFCRRAVKLPPGGCCCPSPSASSSGIVGCADGRRCWPRQIVHRTWLGRRAGPGRPHWPPSAGLLTMRLVGRARRRRPAGSARRAAAVQEAWCSSAGSPGSASGRCSPTSPDTPGEAWECSRTGRSRQRPPGRQRCVLPFVVPWVRETPSSVPSAAHGPDPPGWATRAAEIGSTRPAPGRRSARLLLTLPASVGSGAGNPGPDRTPRLLDYLTPAVAELPVLIGQQDRAASAAAWTACRRPGCGRPGSPRRDGDAGGWMASAAGSGERRNRAERGGLPLVAAALPRACRPTPTRTSCRRCDGQLRDLSPTDGPAGPAGGGCWRSAVLGAQSTWSLVPRWVPGRATARGRYTRICARLVVAEAGIRAHPRSVRRSGRTC